MLDIIKFRMRMTIKELASYLNVSHVTIHSWTNKDSWPSWALRKCGYSFED